MELSLFYARDYRYVNFGPFYYVKIVLLKTIITLSLTILHTNYSRVCIIQFDIFSIFVKKTSVVTIISKIYIAFYQLYSFIVVIYRCVILFLFVIFNAYIKLYAVTNSVWRFVWSSTFLLYKIIAVDAWSRSLLTLFPISRKKLMHYATTVKLLCTFMYFSIIYFVEIWGISKFERIYEYYVQGHYMHFMFMFFLHFSIFSGYNILLNNKQVYNKQDLVNQDYVMASNVCQSPCVTNLLVAIKTFTENL